MSRTNELTKAIITFLELRGCMVWRNNTGGARVAGRGGRPGFIRFGHKGSGDILGIAPGGKFLSIEVKSGLDRPSPDQLAFIANVRANGGLAGIARSVDDAQAILETMQARLGRPADMRSDA